MDLDILGFVTATIGGVLMLVGMLMLVNTEKGRTDITGEVAGAAGHGLYLIYAGLAAIGAGILMMLFA